MGNIVTGLQLRRQARRIQKLQERGFKVTNPWGDVCPIIQETRAPFKAVYKAKPPL